MVEGLAAFHRSAYAKAVELLLPVRFALWQIGGSHAQRDVALSLAHERPATHPRGAPNRRFLRHAEEIVG